MTFPRDLSALKPPATQALGVLLLAMADDEFVLGFSDSEWTGIAPILEEDVAMSSLAQDELGHAEALYGLLAELVHDGRDADAIAYDRPPAAYLHARLLDHGRGDWAMTIARRYLYETADDVRLAALAGSAYGPLRELVAKLRREERYHLMHIGAWFERLASAEGEPRRRLLDALAQLGPDAGTVLAPLPGERGLLDDAFLAEPFAELEARWRARLAPVFERLELPPLPPTGDGARARVDHGEAFRWLHGEFTAVRRLEPGAAW
jgi:ring-1,2-phenylacetyl-CoA epoxidase subunit PaaC